MELAGKRVMVIGLGVSGLAAARLLAAHGARLVMTDLRADFGADSHAEAGGGAGGASTPPGEIHLGAEDPAWLDGVDLVVTSPGVAPTSRLLNGSRPPANPGDWRVGTGQPFRRRADCRGHRHQRQEHGDDAHRRNFQGRGAARFRRRQSGHAPGRGGRGRIRRGGGRGFELPARAHRALQAARRRYISISPRTISIATRISTSTAAPRRACSACRTATTGRF